VFNERDSSQKETISPDLVLNRSSIYKLEDFRNLLYGFDFAQIPMINSSNVLYNSFERPWVFSALKKIQHRLGKDRFPLIPQTYFPNHWCFEGADVELPTVVKVGHIHSGYGKVKYYSKENLEDFVSVLALHKNDYFTTEPFIEKAKFDIRIQKIGKNYRCYYRTGFTWKTNTNTAEIHEIPLTDDYKLWADECSQLFGGIDVLALDAIVDENDKTYILELNSTAIGISPNDEQHVKEVLMERLKEIVDGKHGRTYADKYSPPQIDYTPLINSDPVVDKDMASAFSALDDEK